METHAHDNGFATDNITQEPPNGLVAGGSPTPGLCMHSEHVTHQCAQLGCPEFSYMFHYLHETDLINGLESELGLQFLPRPQSLGAGAECQL